MPFQCELCPVVFSRSDNRLCHYRDDHKIDPFSPNCGLDGASPSNPCCPFCERFFKRQGFLTRHVRQWHDPHWIHPDAAKKGASHCPFCDYYYTSRRGLVQHVRRWHDPKWVHPAAKLRAKLRADHQREMVKFCVDIRRKLAANEDDEEEEWYKKRAPRCTFCDDYFYTEDSLDQHVQDIHDPYMGGHGDDFLNNVRLGSQPKVNFTAEH